MVYSAHAIVEQLMTTTGFVDIDQVERIYILQIMIMKEYEHVDTLLSWHENKFL